jgi:predicted nuclease of predicted toxin-antitoxin system
VKFLLDQSADARLIPCLRDLGHDAIRIGREFPPGLPDAEVLQIAQNDNRVLITDDTDFGDLVVRLRQPHTGVILFRLGSAPDLTLKIERLAYVLANYRDCLDQFLVVTKRRVRVHR